jgi:hypothetical protein
MNDESNPKQTQGPAGNPPLSPPPPEPTQPKPHSVQTGYWAHDLTLKYVAIAISLLGFAFVIYSIHINTRQLQLNSKQLLLNYEAATNAQLHLKNDTQQSMTKLTMDLDQLIIDHPELRPYLEGNANPTNDSQINYSRAVDGAIMTLDVFDVARVQVGTFRSEWTNPEGWTNWIIDDFAHSPFLREEYRKCASWYGPDMTAMMNSSTNRSFYADYETNGIVRY